MKNLDPGAVFFLGEVRTLIHLPGRKKDKIISMSYRQFLFCHYLVLSRRVIWSIEQAKINWPLARKWLRNKKLKTYRTMLARRAHRKMLMNADWYEEQIFKSITDKRYNISAGHLELLDRKFGFTEKENTSEYNFLTKEAPGSNPQLPPPPSPSRSGEKPGAFRISDGGEEIRENKTDASPPSKGV